MSRNKFPYPIAHGILFSDFWPSLLDIPGFLQQFITPIVKSTKGKKSFTFFTLPEYEK
jgi:DNA topoisomerase-2